MAHDLAFRNGRAMMAYQGETPWHGLGTKVESLRSVNAALEAAQLNWNVALEPMYRKVGDKFQVSNLRRTVVRDFDNAELGTAGMDYHTVQNSEAFEILQPACEEFGVTIESAGAIKGGSRVWMLAKMPDVTIEPVPGDSVRGYFLVMSGHDGTLSHHSMPTPIRVVCKNTLQAATGLGEGKRVKGAMFTIRHSKSAADRLSMAKDMVTGMVGALQKTGETFADMARLKMSADDVINYIEAVFPNPDAKKEVSTILANRRKTVARLVFTGAGSEMARSMTNGEPNAWAVYNAVTEYFDHVRPAETGSSSARANANESAIFGTGAAVKLEALKRAAELVAV
jgi:phage/plasmid-like protein (TIGR03299 family)